VSIGAALAAVDAQMALNAFFHGSRVPLPVGAVLEAQRKPRYLDKGSEMLLEQERPQGAPPRYETWYMVDDPCDVTRMGGGDDYVYEVAPRAPVTAANYDWLSRIHGRRGDVPSWALKDDPEARQYARNYWAGAPLDDDPQREWLTSTVEILRETRCPPAEQARRFAARTRAREARQARWREENL